MPTCKEGYATELVGVGKSRRRDEVACRDIVGGKGKDG
jgi:hypothetical protein